MSEQPDRPALNIDHEAMRAQGAYDRREAGGCNAAPRGGADVGRHSASASPSAYHHKLSIKLADLVRECGCRCKDNRAMCDICGAAVAIDVDGPALLASEGVVDPAQVFIMQQEYAVKVLGLEQQLAALRAEARKDENRVANARSERDALRAKVAEAEKDFEWIRKTTQENLTCGSAAKALAALREGGSDD